jgi:hypothetical protein
MNVVLAGARNKRRNGVGSGGKLLIVLLLVGSP